LRKRDTQKFGGGESLAMVVNGRALPRRLLSAIRGLCPLLRGGRRYLPGGPCCLRGQFLLYDLPAVARETGAVVQAIRVGDEFFTGDPAAPVDPTRLVCIGDSGLDSPVCLEFREGAEEPRVIWLNDQGRWVQLAPNLDGFLRTFWLRGYA
jgi:hypothetical protein